MCSPEMRVEYRHAPHLRRFAKHSGLRLCAALFHVPQLVGFVGGPGFGRICPSKMLKLAPPQFGLCVVHHITADFPSLMFCPFSSTCLPLNDGIQQVCRLLLETPRPANGGRDSDSSATGEVVDVYIGSDIPAAEGTTPFHWAAWGAHLSTCRLLLSRGADHRRVNAYGCTVAHWCGLSGDVDVCRYE